MSTSKYDKMSITELRKELVKRGRKWEALPRSKLTQIFMDMDCAKEKEDSEDVCAICLEKPDGDSIALDCYHSFHKACLGQMHKAECPMCRAPQTKVPVKPKEEEDIEEVLRGLGVDERLAGHLREIQRLYEQQVAGNIVDDGRIAAYLRDIRRLYQQEDRDRVRVQVRFARQQPARVRIIQRRGRTRVSL